MTFTVPNSCVCPASHDFRPAGKASGPHYRPLRSFLGYRVSEKIRGVGLSTSRNALNALTSSRNRHIHSLSPGFGRAMQVTIAAKHIRQVVARRSGSLVVALEVSFLSKVPLSSACFRAFLDSAP